jgi:hypothetical protein
MSLTNDLTFSEAIEKAFKYSDNTHEEEWARFQSQFAMQSKEQRYQTLTWLDELLDNEPAALTKDYAATIQKKRNLDSLHKELMRAGR